MERPKAWVSWSSGKDSAWSLEVVRRQNAFDIRALLTTVNAEHQRVAMHAVRESLLRAQAESVGLPLVTVPIPSPCPNAVYEKAMACAIEQAREQGITHIIFGDLFLEDIRKYREEKLAGTGIQPLFPLWGLDTRRLAREMVQGGLEAYLACIDPKKLGSSFAGRRFDADFLADLPENIDPCGENGEFHTFVYTGPMFQSPLEVELGIILERDGFVFADVSPKSTVA